ncbi:TPA: hypothetical protein QCX73_000574 [Bacillus mycoides]|nr:hypothetical protein [Bacillus mycoides]HDR7626109.1 hypothetical protein [Bacillus mycoides]
MDTKQMVAMTFIKPEHGNVNVATVEENMEEVKEYAEQQGYHLKGFSNIDVSEKQYHSTLKKGYKMLFKPSDK